MSFKTQIAADFRVFLNTSEFAEQIMYVPKGGTALSVKAVLSRQQVDGEPIDRNRVLRNKAEIWIANNADYGITAPKRGDTVQFSVEVNGSTVDWIVDDILEGDEGVWHLGVGR